MKSEKDQSLFLSLFIPNYDELSLFIMAYVCILLLGFNYKELKGSLAQTSVSLRDLEIALLIFLPLIIGTALCLYHAFSAREKTNIEKKFMIFFAAIINGFSGIWYRTYILVNSSGWGLSLFPFGTSLTVMFSLCLYGYRISKIKPSGMKT